MLKKSRKYIVLSGLILSILNFSASRSLAIDANITNQSSSISKFPTAPSGNSLTLAAVPAGYCELRLTNVHMSTSTPNNVAADGSVNCALGQSIRISTMVITLHKVGILPHYYSGPNYGGYADYWNPLYYSMFKTPCVNTNSSTYWSTAHAEGTYPDGSFTYANATSPNIQLQCGTSF